MNLFRYCGDDPVDGSDPMGLLVYFNQHGNNVNLYFPATFVNLTGLHIESAMTATANKTWTGQWGKFNTTMNIYTPKEGMPTNTIFIRQGTQQSVAYSASNYAIIYVPGQYPRDLGKVLAHEIGHLMRLIYGGPHGNSLDRSSIMGDIGGKPTQKDIDLILRQNRDYEMMRTGAPAPKSNRGNVLFGQSNTRGAVYNTGGGWESMGGASVNLRWMQNSGTGNWQSAQTADAYFLNGGENHGEGSHPPGAR